MTLYWTLQKEEIWDQSKQQGYLEGKQQYAMYPTEYLWMMEQMKNRIPNYSGEYPIWLWIKKPDMRSTSHFGSYTKCVRITVELEPADVLVSDFLDWHCVLNDGFNAHNEQEYDDFYEGKLVITKEQSWERMFDYNRPRDPVWGGSGDWLQGVTGRIYLGQIRKVEHFISRKQAVL
jgi:hypothetical protein